MRTAFLNRRSRPGGYEGRKDYEMKVKALTGIMNDFGTKPRVKIMKHTDDAAILVYEGSLKNMDEEMQSMKVNSFTVLGKGYIEIHVK